MVLVPVLALSVQTRLPLYISYASMLDLALLVTVYFASNRRNQIVGLSLGAAIGLAQDSLVAGPIGAYGIVKTIIGYLASSLGGQIDATHPLMRMLLVFCSYYIHLALYFVLIRGLLDRPMNLPGWRSLAAAAINAVVALLLFPLLDKMRIRE